MSIYDEDEPYARICTGDTHREAIDGHVFNVTATSETGLNSGRRRFRVQCTTCDALIHPATTGPRENIDMHLQAAKRGEMFAWR